MYAEEVKILLKFKGSKTAQNGPISSRPLGQTTGTNRIYCINVFAIICRVEVAQSETCCQREPPLNAASISWLDCSLRCQSLRQICKKLWNLKRDQCMYRLCVCVWVGSVTVKGIANGGIGPLTRLSQYTWTRRCLLHFGAGRVPGTLLSVFRASPPTAASVSLARQRIISLIGLRC